MTFRQSATDADNHLETNVAAIYVQDQIELSTHARRSSAGLRFDRFDLQYHNNRNGDTLAASTISSRRAPASSSSRSTPLSLYASYSVSYLPSSGDQFSSLTTITEQVKPEKFNNYEVGAKWDVAAGALADRRPCIAWIGPTRARPIRTIRRASSRPAASAPTASSSGVNGQLTPRVEHRRRLRLSGRVRHQRDHRSRRRRAGRARCRTTRSRCGTTIRSRRDSAAGLGIVHRTDMFAAIDNTVTLPATPAPTRPSFFSLTHAAAPAGERREPVRHELLRQCRQQHQHLARHRRAHCASR